MTSMLSSCPGPDGRPTNPFEPFPRAALEGSLTARFTRQVTRDPHRLAVKMGAVALSYGALDRSANRVAHAICDRIGGGNEPVVLLLPQSLDQVVAVLGALKAGKIYVPLDPAHPPARLGEAVADAGARLVVTSTRFAGLARAVAPSAAAVEVDALRDGADGLPAEAPAVAIGPDAGAYIFYTSGSTGRPKGVLDTHRNVLHNVMRYTNTLHLTSDDRLTLLQGPSFSGAVSSLFGALLNGATSLLFDVPRDGAERLAGWLAEEAVTVYHSVPALFRAIAPRGGSLPALRLIRLEGDRATPRDLALFREHFAPDCVLVNGLGATECGLVRQFFFTTASPMPDGVVPIGAAVEDMDVVVLDAAGHPAGTGEPGEIGVRSAYLAAGYWNQSELTAARFVVEPDRPGTRLYRTGDLGRLRADGLLELLGRRDGMAKVRGHHVEVAEVEAALLALPGVAEAAALVREDTPGEARLVAYLGASDHDGLTPSALRRALAERLPDFMLPSAFVFLDRLPLDGNRKVDRRALPAPGPSHATRTLAAPRTPRESELARIWAAVLDVETVGIDDDFFDLGGNSVLAALVLARAHDTWGVEIDLATFAASPTVAALARALESATGDAPATPLAPARRAQAVPLLPTSFAQERLWFVDQLDPGRATYSMTRAWRLAGPLDSGALERALQYLGRRHETLRTVVVGMDGRPWQRVLPDADITLVVTDLDGVEAPAREAEAERLLADESTRPFDLARGPLWRARLLRLDNTHHVLVVTIHHIVSDGWSLDVLSRELSAAYRAALAGLDPALPPLPLQYADFAAWQRERLSSGALEPLLAHWRARLAGAPAALTIATDRPRPARPRGRSARLPFTVPAGVTAALRALGRREGATLFMTLLAGYALLLHRRSGQTDLLIGAPMANRPRREVEGLIGLFLDTLVLRVDCGERPTFRELLGRARATAFDAYAHQDLPFEKLVEAVRPDRGPAGTPLLSALLNLLNQPASPLRLDRLTATRIEVPSSGSKFDLSLALSETPAGLDGALTYDADLFEPDTAQTLLTQLARVLEHVAVDPDCRLDEIPLVSEAERGALVARSQGPAAPAPSAPSLAALVEAQAARTPDAVAVVQGERTLTYAALVARARRLARQLRVLGAGQDEPVGVCLGRSPDLVVALLAALEAGAPYIALDPDDPPARIGRTLQTAGARCVLTRTDLESRCGGNGLATICLDREDSAADDGEAMPLADGPGPDDLAYIAFTSGSTGAPKGVSIAHRGVVSYLEFLVRTFGLGPSDVVLQLARASFDASVREIFAPLVVGARVVLLADAEAPDPAAILARLRAHRVTALLAVVPSVLRPLTGAAEDRGLSAPALRLVLTTGEPLIYDDVRRVRRHLAPGAEVVNQYGPTECTMTSTFYRVDGDGVDGVDGVVPIGRPIAGMSALILDPALGPVPPGVPGELYLGGVGVARGYLGDPELTERRFVPDPFAVSPGGRLYKTGDLVRARRDGVLEFLGRIDRQIKVRGIRTEPAEAEHALREHPAVREVAVVPWEPTPGDQRLAAYVVGRGTAPPDRHALRQYARDHLPAHLVPAAFVPVAALPLTANRKLDRDALPPPGPADAIGAPAHVAPRTPLEAALAEIWGEMLGLPRVGVLDDFFDLGGHSLLAARLVARLRDRIGLDVPLRQIFETPTIADLVLALLDAQMETGLVGAPDPASPEPSEGDPIDAARSVRRPRPGNAGGARDSRARPRAPPLSSAPRSGGRRGRDAGAGRPRPPGPHRAGGAAGSGDGGGPPRRGDGGGVRAAQSRLPRAGAGGDTRRGEARRADRPGRHARARGGPATRAGHARASRRPLGGGGQPLARGSRRGRPGGGGAGGPRRRRPRAPDLGHHRTAEARAAHPPRAARVGARASAGARARGGRLLPRPHAALPRERAHDAARVARGGIGRRLPAALRVGARLRVDRGDAADVAQRDPDRPSGHPGASGARSRRRARRHRPAAAIRALRLRAAARARGRGARAVLRRARRRELRADGDRHPRRGVPAAAARAQARRGGRRRRARDRHHGRRRPPRRRRQRRRDRGPRTQRHGRLRGRSRGRRVARGRLVPHRRSRPARPGRVPLHHGADQGRDQPRRREDRPPRDRRDPPRSSGGARRGNLRRTASDPGRGRGGGGGARGGRDPGPGGPAAVRGRARGHLQGAPAHHVPRRHPARAHRQARPRRPRAG